ncbi:MAG: hypothetical protein ACRDPW_04965, partial [Mycobacteriales bacterium]
MTKRRSDSRRLPRVATTRGRISLLGDWRKQLSGKLARGLRTAVGGGARGAWRRITAVPGATAAALRGSVSRQRTIRPEPIGPRKRNLRRLYSIALVGVAVLTVLARLNNAQGFATAFFIALLLGLLFIAWTGYRSALATAAAIGWWLITTPLVSLAAAAGLPSQEALLRAATSNEAIIGTGIAVWVSAVLLRSRRTWLTIMVCWAINIVAVLGAAFVAPRFGLAGGWLAITLFLTWRAGWLLAAYDRLTGAARIG